MVEGVLVTATGVAVIFLCVLGARSNSYPWRTVENVLRTRRRKVTPDAIARRLPYVKWVLIIGIVVGMGVAALGMITLVEGVLSGANGPMHGSALVPV